MADPWKRREVIGNAVLYLGDCLEILPTLPKVDAVITDPPYGIAHPADSARFSGGNTRRGVGSTHALIVGDDSPFDPSPFLGFTKVILWGMNNFPAHLPAGSALVWIKRNDAALGSFLSDAEIAYLSGGCGVYAYKEVAAGSSRAMEWCGNAYAPSAHPTQKPEGLMRWCVAKTTGTVCDPFMGSGTTGVACMQLGRKFLGIEVYEPYFDIAQERIENAQRQKPMFEYGDSYDAVERAEQQKLEM